MEGNESFAFRSNGESTGLWSNASSTNGAISTSWSRVGNVASASARWRTSVPMRWARSVSTLQPLVSSSGRTSLLLRLHTETACRRGGALGLRLIDLDVDHGLVRLREKGGTLRWQPITLDLADALAEHAAAAAPSCPPTRCCAYRDGRALTSRRYDHLWHRLGQRLPWVAAQGISTHWLRHTTLTWVERHFGYGIARAYAGHTDSTGPATTTYIKADSRPSPPRWPR